MERSLIKQVNVKNMGARLKSKNVRPMLYPNFFGTKKKASLTWSTLVGEKGAPVVADIISFDSSAPQKTREVISKLSGDIPKTAVKRGMNESEFNEYKQLERDAQSDADQLELLNLAFKDQDFVYNSVRARFEWWCMQLMSKAGFHLTASNNNGIVTAEFVGCGMPSDNKKVSTKDWADANNADGLQDIEDVIHDASGEGVIIKYIVMHVSDFALLKKQKATIEKIKAWIGQTGKAAVNKKSINDFLADQEIPVKIYTVSPAVRVEDKSHRRKTVNPWERKRICFLEELNVGNIQYGPIAAESSPQVQKIAIMAKQDFILVSKWSELEPYKEWTKAETNAFPVIDDPDSMFILKADGAAWAANEDTEGTDKVPAKFLGEEVDQESNKTED